MSVAERVSRLVERLSLELFSLLPPLCYQISFLARESRGERAGAVTRIKGFCFASI